VRALLAILSTISIFSTTSSAIAEEKIRIGWVYAMANAPVLIAEQKGFFREQGLDAEIVEYKSGPLVHRALTSGKLDMAYIGSPPVYHWISRGLESRILAKVNYGQAAVISRKNSGISSLSDLKGKKIAGIHKGSGMDVLLRGFVLGDAAKLVPDRDVELMTMSPGEMEAALERKIVDAAFIWEPFISSALIRGKNRLIFDMNKAAPKYPWYVVMAMPGTLRENRTAVVKVLKAHKQAVDFLNSSASAGNDIIARAFKLKAVTDVNGKRHKGTEIIAMARGRLGWEYELKKADIEFIQRMMDYSYKLGYIRKKISTDQIIDTSMMAEALE
jgi:NitT/TauT family transport system substrate-binding protein